MRVVVGRYLTMEWLTQANTSPRWAVFPVRVRIEDRIARTVEFLDAKIRKCSDVREPRAHSCGVAARPWVSVLVLRGRKLTLYVA